MTISLCMSACTHVQPVQEEEEPPNIFTPGLGGERVGRLFECVSTVQRKNPASVHWVHPLEEAPGYFVTTQFDWVRIRMYSGHEIVVFGKEKAGYYWMPGAEHDATGLVPNGTYRVDGESPEPGKMMHLRFEKRHPTAFVLLEQGSALAAKKDEMARPISPRPLPYEWVAEEMHEIAYHGLNFYVQALRSESLRGQVAPLLADRALFNACRDVSARLDTVLGRIEDELATPSSQGTR